MSAISGDPAWTNFVRLARTLRPTPRNSRVREGECCRRSVQSNVWYVDFHVREHYLNSAMRNEGFWAIPETLALDDAWIERRDLLARRQQ